MEPSVHPSTAGPPAKLRDAQRSRQTILDAVPSVAGA